MPPKRSKQISESTNMHKKKLCEDQNAIKSGKMAAQHSNTADLRALLQATLEQLGDTYDPTGYAYVNVGEGSCANSLQTEDPLGSQEKTSAKGTFLHTLNLHANGTQSIIANMVEGGAEEAQGSAFLSGLSVDYLDETVGCGEIEPTDEPCETCPSKGGNATAATESTNLVAQRLSVTELRQMLQAALKHEEKSLNVPDSPKIISSTTNVAVTTLVAVENLKHSDHLGEISGDPKNYTKASEKSGIDFEACTPQLEANNILNIHVLRHICEQARCDDTIVLPTSSLLDAILLDLPPSYFPAR